MCKVTESPKIMNGYQKIFLVVTPREREWCVFAPGSVSRDEVCPSPIRVTIKNLKTENLKLLKIDKYLCTYSS